MSSSIALRIFAPYRPSSIPQLLVRIACMPMLALVFLLCSRAQAQSLAFTGSAAETLSFQTLEKPFVRRLLTENSLGTLRIELQAASAAELNGRSLTDRVLSGNQAIAALTLSQLPAGDAWFDLADLTGLALDVPSARAAGNLYRDRAQGILKEKFGLRLLASAAVQAQALYCRSAFFRLADLKGRRVRVESVLQAALVESLSGIAVRLSADEVRSALASKNLDCAIGGTMSGNLARWHEVSSHLFSLPIAWNVSHYVIAEKTWASLDPAVRGKLQTEFRNFETRVWESALVYTREGFNCNAGVEPCRSGLAGKMNIVIGADSDRTLLLKSMNEVVLPAWSARCGPACSAVFNEALAKQVGFKPIK